MGLIVSKLSPRHHHMAYMVAAGKSNREIAAALGYTEPRVSVIKSSPLFQAMVNEIQRELASRAVEDIVEGIVAEGPRSLKRMTELRDQDDNPSVAYNAASYLLDKNPKVAAIKAVAEASVNLMLDGTAVSRMNRAMAEADGRVIDAADEPALPPPAFGGLKTLDEAIAEAAAHADR